MSNSDRSPGDRLKDTEPIELNPRSPQAIKASYGRFKSHISDLCKELESFSKECSHLRWSYALIRSNHELRFELGSFLSNIYENARHLSPSIQDSDMQSLFSRSGKDDLQSSPLWFEQLAESFEDFRENLNEFREYTNELTKIDTLLNAMIGNLNYRAACLAMHNNNFDRNMHYYVHELAGMMEQGLVGLTMSVRLFTTYGMPGLQYEQRSDIEGVLNVSAVATFFSAVTATMLQISISFPSSVTLSIVNTFWFCSLVLSIGSALNSILVIAWKRSIFGSQRRLILPWITVWIRASVPVLLAVSIACFSAGLGLFTFASHQAKYTSALTLAATAIASLGLLSLLLILAYEYWFAPIVIRKAPEKRGSKLQSNIPQPIVSPTLEKTNTLSSGYSDLSSSSSTTVVSRPARLIRAFNHIFRGGSPAPPPAADQEQGVDDAPALESLEITPQLLATEEGARQRWIQTAGKISSMVPVTKLLWEKVPQGVPRMTVDHQTLPPSRPMIRTDSSSVPQTSREPPDRVIPLRHGALQDLEYSPNKRLLAITNYDSVLEQSTTMIFITEHYAYTFRHLHSQRRISKQVAWSPDGARLLVRLSHSFDVLNSNCMLIYTVSRPHLIENAAWFNQTGFLSVEKSTVFRLSAKGEVLATYQFEKLLLRAIAVIPKSNLLLVVGRVMFPDEHLLPVHGRTEKQLILYDMRAEIPVNRHPVLDDVRHITLASHLLVGRYGFDVLLGHRNTVPPRFWTLEPSIRGSHQLKPGPIHLQTAGLSGPAYLAGQKENFLLCADHNGSMHIWDRASGEPLLCVEAQASTTQSRNAAVGPVDPRGRITFASAGTTELNVWSFEQPS